MKPFVHDLNHNNEINFAKFAAAGGVGIIHKATQGLSFTDQQYGLRRELAGKVGLEWAAYDFCTNDDVQENVARFLAVAKPDAKTGLWLDYERNPAHQMTITQAIEFLDRVDQLVGRRCGIYGGGDALKPACVHLTDSQREFLGAHPYWICQYGPVTKMTDPNGHPLPWSKWFLWQYTDGNVGPLPHTMPGLGSQSDLSTFDGTEDELRAAWAGAALAPATA